MRYAPCQYTDAASHAARPQALLFKLYPVEYGALTQLWAGTMPEALEHNGEVRSVLCPAARARV